MKRLQEVKVYWKDSKVYGGWSYTMDFYEEKGPGECVTVGFLVRKDKEMVVVVQNATPSKRGNVPPIGESIAIPRGCVQKIVQMVEEEK